MYKPELENKAADALSRMPPTIHLYNLSALTIIDLKVIEVLKKTEKVMSELDNQEVEAEWKFSMQQGMLRYKDRLVISNSSSLILAILHTYHDSVLGAIQGS